MNFEDSCRKAQADRTMLACLLGVGLLVLCLIGLPPVFDTSEARYALVSLRMLLSGDWVTPTIDGTAPFWGKPPLAFWMSASSMRLLGVNEFAARLPVFMCVAGTVCLIVWHGGRVRDRSFGLFAGLVLASMLFTVLSSAYLLTDQVLVFAITAAMISFWTAVADRHPLAGYAFFASLAAAILAKGLVGIAYIGTSLLVWLTFERRWNEAVRILPIISGGLVMLVIAAPWYLRAELRTPGFANYFFLGEHLQKYLVPGWTGDLYGVGRSRWIGWIWPYAFIGALPWSVLVLVLMARKRATLRATATQFMRDAWIRFLLCWAIVPLVFLTFARNGGLPYVLPMLAPAAILIAQFVGGWRWKHQQVLLLGLCWLAPGVLAVLTVVILAWPGQSLLPSQRATIAAWDRLKGPDRGAIVYLFFRPYSAQFYTRGGAGLVSTAQDALDLARTSGQKYFATPWRCLPLIPRELRDQFTVLARQNATALLGYGASSGLDWPDATLDAIRQARAECLADHPP